MYLGLHRQATNLSLIFIRLKGISTRALRFNNLHFYFSTIAYSEFVDQQNILLNVTHHKPT